MFELLLTLAVTWQSRPGLMGTVPSTVIVGRAVCGSTTWLLTEAPELVELRRDAGGQPTLSVRPLRGTVAGDKIWGLACPGDGSLWTLASPRSLARIDASGRLADRTNLRSPGVALYAAGERLLRQSLPIIPGSATLVAFSATNPDALTPWPGLLAKQAERREREIAGNLVVCGIAFERKLPCWFADDRQFTVSDGVTARVISAARWLSARADRDAPIRDVALAGPDRFWILESGTGTRGVTGRRLMLVDEKSGFSESYELQSGARLIFVATSTHSLILMSDGGLLEISARP